MTPPVHFRPGDRVRVSPFSPLRFQGAGPGPGDIGRITAISRSGDDILRLCAVRFGSDRFEWLVPLVFLEPVRETGRRQPSTPGRIEHGRRRDHAPSSPQEHPSCEK